MYYLDCNIINYLVRGDEALAERIDNTPPDDLAVSTVTAEELLGPQFSEVKKLRDDGKSFERESTFLANLIMVVGSFNIKPYTEEAELRYKRFQGKTRRIGPKDARLAAHVSLTDSVVVTKNVTDFEQICKNEALTTVGIEDWTKKET